MFSIAIFLKIFNQMFFFSREIKKNSFLLSTYLSKLYTKIKIFKIKDTIFTNIKNRTSP